MKSLERAKVAVAAALAVSALILAAIPAILVYRSAEGTWQGVPPEVITDSLYYYAQIKEAADGHATVGNPFFFEHRNDIAPAFFLSVDVTAVPLLLGLSLTVSILINLVFWNLLFLSGTYLLVHAFGLRRLYAITAAWVAYLGSYMFMIRPVAMQVVFPAYLFFLYALWRWLRQPGKMESIFLAGMIGLSPYVYPFLAYVIFLTMLVTLLWLLLSRLLLEVKRLLFVGLCACVIALPYLSWILVPQITSPWFFESVTRIGLVATRLPSMEVFSYGRWVIITLASFAVLRFWRPRQEGAVLVPQATVFFSITGVGLILMSVSNVVTAQDSFLGIHTGRVIILWSALALSVLVFVWVEQKKYLTAKSAVLGFLILVLAAGYLRNLPRALVFFSPAILGETRLVQPYAEPLAWLYANTAAESVVWANDDLSRYIPMLTKNYVLYANAGGLQLMPTSEFEDRYLLSRFRTQDALSLRDSFPEYAGAGRWKEQPLALNRYVGWCTRFRFIMSYSDCGERVTWQSIVPDSYFENLSRRYAYSMKNRESLLRSFRVEYLLLDAEADPSFETLGLRGAREWSNGRFSIYYLTLGK